MEARIARLRSKILEEIIAMSTATDWPEGEEIRCPNWGAKMERMGKHKRKL